jgi:cytochrome c-type biogenesis protein CcmH/NrfG
MAYARLGEAYLGVGDTASAKAAYQRSLQLNPTNRNAADLLKRLGGPP